MNDNILDFVVYPAHVANGTTPRAEIMERLMNAAKNCDLTAIDKLKFYKEVEKAANEAPKQVDDQYDMTVADAALEMAEAITGGVKGEFPYNGCDYQMREELEHDLSDTDKYRGEFAVAWREAKKKLEASNVKMANLRNEQASLRQDMETAAKNYANTHPSYVPNIKHSLVVLDSAKKKEKNQKKK